MRVLYSTLVQGANGNAIARVYGVFRVRSASGCMVVTYEQVVRAYVCVCGHKGLSLFRVWGRRSGVKRRATQNLRCRR